MLIFAIEGTAYGCEGVSKRKDLAADQQVVILGSDRMPKDAFRRYGHFGNQVGFCQSDTLYRGSSQGNSPDDPVLLADLVGIKEAAEFLGLQISRHCCRQSYPETFGADQLDPLPCARPCPHSTMALEKLRRWAVEADLESHALGRQ